MGRTVYAKRLCCQFETARSDLHTGSHRALAELIAHNLFTEMCRVSSVGYQVQNVAVLELPLGCTFHGEPWLNTWNIPQ